MNTMMKVNSYITLVLYRLVCSISIRFDIIDNDLLFELIDDRAFGTSAVNSGRKGESILLILFTK